MEDEFQKFIKQNEKTIRCHKNPNKNYKLSITNDVLRATHWRATPDTMSPDKSGVTVGHTYPIYYDRFNNEELIVDDIKNFSLIYLCHNGELLIAHKRV